MFHSLRHSRRAFTMMELMIVIAIIGILMGIGILPYGQYVQQARLSNMVDLVAQEWVLTHKEIRNGKEFPKQNPNDEIKHATVLLYFEKWKNFYTQYIFETPKDWDENQKADEIFKNQNWKEEKKISFEGGVEILGVDGADMTSGTINSTNNDLYYLMFPPYAHGKFYSSKDVNSQISKDSQTIVIGYPNAKTIHSGRAKTILLRPYLQ